MPLRPLRQILISSAIAGTIVVCLPSIAHAEIAVFNEASLPRISSDGKTVRKRDIALKPEGVNYQDCVDDQRIRFALNLSAGFEGNASLQAWAGLAGADCGVQTNRTSGTAATCWQLATGIPLSVNPTVDIPVRAIMAGAPPNRPADVLPGTVPDKSVCGTVDLAQISVQFLYFAPGQLATPAQTKAIAIEVDTIGPPPPTGLKTMPGNGRIKVEWDNISGEGGVSVLTGVKVYCDLVTGGGASTATDAATSEPAEASCTEVPNTPDAGDGGDGGDIDAGTTLVCEEAGAPSSAGSAAASSCSSPNFTTDVIPDAEFNKQFECGSVTGNSAPSVVATSLQGKPLANRTADNPGATYAVAVAATDAFNNVGPLSSPKCEYAEETTDFWENYRKAGGEAGGGCATSGAPVGSISAFAAIGLAAISAFRRRRPRRSSERRATGQRPRR